MDPKPQKHARKIKVIEGVELIERLTFYPSLIPKVEEELWEIVGKEFPLLKREEIDQVLQIDGTLDIIPKEPQPRPESFVEYEPLTIWYVSRPKSLAEMCKIIQENFWGVRPDQIEVVPGYMSVCFKVKR
ncbi:MAG: hypothetical protein WCO18_01625 [bacterium]